MAIEEALRLRDGRTLVFTSTGRAGSGGGAGPGTGDAWWCRPAPQRARVRAVCGDADRGHRRDELRVTAPDPETTKPAAMLERASRCCIQSCVVSEKFPLTALGRHVRLRRRPKCRMSNVESRISIFGVRHWTFGVEAGGGLLSHDLAIAVPSALTGLTTVFGMGTGVALSR